ncbi:hypothetical protein [Vreelandella sp. EE22]
MRDLYKRLALSPTVDEQTLNQALADCPNSALRQDAEATLAMDEHRKRYDELHTTLSDIGRLRAHLGLTHAPHWQGNTANDFSLPPDSAESCLDDLLTRVDKAATLYDRWHRFRGPWLLIAVFAVGAGIGLALGLSLLAGSGARPF